MSKFSRDALKELIKECVVEVLQESFGALQLVREVQVKSYKQPRKVASAGKTSNSTYTIDDHQYEQRSSHSLNETYEQSPRASHLDNITYNGQSSPSTPPTTNFENKINNITQAMTSDPVLADIFKDTARTTLQEQISAESRRGTMPISRGDEAARTVSQSDPTELFGAAAGKWAQLAFASSAKGAK